MAREDRKKNRYFPLGRDGLQTLECNTCHDVQIDSVSARERTKKILTKLIQYYSPRMNEVPGKVVYWMRHAIGLSQTELAEKVGGMILWEPFLFQAVRIQAVTRD